MDGYDAMLVFGVGPVERRRNGGAKLPLFGRINALAAGMLLERYSVERLIPSGSTTGGRELPSEASLMAQLIRACFDVPPHLITLESLALNTIQNIIYTYNMVWSPRRDHVTFLMVASGYHIPRIQQICDMLFIEADYCAAEDVLKERSSWHKDILERITDSAVNPIYGDILAMESRWRRGLREIPEYWLSELALFRNMDQARRVLAERPECRDYVEQNIRVPLERMSDDALRDWLSNIPIKRPPMSWAEEPM